VRTRPATGPIETQTRQDVIRSLEFARGIEGEALTMIAGGPGIGKTRALLDYRFLNRRDTWIFTATEGEGGVWCLATSLFRQMKLGEANSRDLPGARLLIADHITPEGVLIIDEVQYLVKRNGRGKDDVEAFEWLRSAAGLGQFTLVFCGDLSLARIVGAIPQLDSRMVRSVVVNSVSRIDVAAVIAGTPFDSNPAIDALFAIARRSGGLRNVENVTRVAQMFAGNKAPTNAHLKAAIADMKLAARGTV
jgi:Mu B transposition protein, C terminal/AAA domain